LQAVGLSAGRLRLAPKVTADAVDGTRVDAATAATQARVKLAPRLLLVAMDAA
jgi:hypothetical protein